MVKGVLREELEHAKRAKQRYEEGLDELPRGSLQKKKINDKAYYYIAYRNGNKVKFDYLGKLSDADIKSYREKIEKRKRYKKLIKDLDKEIKYLGRVLNVQAD